MIWYIAIYIGLGIAVCAVVGLAEHNEQQDRDGVSWWNW